MSVEFWAEFFQAAGLEPTVAASYANIFFVNKIQLTHLPDIDRGALREMNITPMGDILTILKYIKRSCPLVTSPTTTPGNELLLYEDDNVSKSQVKLRNISGYCDQNQFECGAQHSIANSEKSFLSSLSPKACQIRPVPSANATHYLPSADIQAGGELPPATVQESPLNLTVHGNYRTNIKINNEHHNSQYLELPDYKTSLNVLCNSVNSTVSCDTSEVTRHMYPSSPDKLEMGRSTDSLKNNLEKSMNVSYADSCEEHSVVKEKIIISGEGTSHQKKSVFERLGQRSDEEQKWVKTRFKQFSQNRHFNNKLRQKCTPQRDNGIMRSNHLRKKWHCSPVDDDRVNNNKESLNTLTMDISQSLTSRILLSVQQDEKMSRSASDNIKLSQETVTVGPDAIFITHTPPCFSSSPQNEDPELESLRDPTFIQHREQFYLAWADRRKQAHSFPGLKPSFLQES